MTDNTPPAYNWQNRDNAIFMVIVCCIFFYTFPIWVSWIGIFTEFDREKSSIGEIFVRGISKNQGDLGILKKLLLPLISALTIKSLWGMKNSNKGWFLIILLVLSLGALLLSVELVSSEASRKNLLSYDAYFTSKQEVELAINNYLGSFLEGIATLIILIFFLDNATEKGEPSD